MNNGRSVAPASLPATTKIKRIVALRAICFWAGHAPAGAVTFFCLPKRKVTKEKGTPVRRSPVGRLPCVARHAGLRIRTRAIRCAATRSNMNPPTAPGAAALLGGSQGPQKRRGANSRASFQFAFLLRSTIVSNRAICSAGFQPATTETESREQSLLRRMEIIRAMRFAYCTLRAAPSA